MRRSLALGFVLLSMLPVVAHGQLCLGQPSFSRAPMQVNAGLTSGDNVTTIGGGLSWGGADLFGGVNIGLVDYDNVDEGAFVLGGAIGYQMAAASTPRASSNVGQLQFCPVATFQYQMGPEFDFFDESIDLSAWTLAGGIALGLPVDASPSFQLIPTGGVSLAYTKLTAEFGDFSESESETYGIITLGLGFLFNQTFSVKPYVDIPVGLEGADARLGISATFGIGRR